MAIVRLRKWLKERRFWCNALAALVSLIFVAPTTFWLLDNTPPFVLRDGKTIPAQVQAGGPYRTSWEVKHIRSCPGTVTVSIVDSQKKITTIIAQPIYFVHLGEKGKFQRAESRERYMPDSVAVGPAKLYIDNVFYCNPLQYKLNLPIIIRHPPIETEIIR